MDGYWTQLVDSLRYGEAFNISNTREDGRGMRRVNFDPQRSRSLIQVPNERGFVFNPNRGTEGLINFLRLKGYNKTRINKILKGIFISSPRRYDREEIDDGTRYIVVHTYPVNVGDILFRNATQKYFFTNIGLSYDQTTRQYQFRDFEGDVKTRLSVKDGDPYQLSDSHFKGYLANAKTNNITMNSSGNPENYLFQYPFYSISNQVSVLQNFNSGPGHSLLFPGQTLYMGDKLISPSGQYTLLYQDDGNIVINGPHGYNKKIFDCGQYTYHQDLGGYHLNNIPSQDCEVNQCPTPTESLMLLPLPLPGSCGSTCHVNNAYLTFQSDGNLVLYHPTKRDPNDPNKPLALWASGPQNSNNPYLILQDNGVLGIYASGQVVWTCQGYPIINDIGSGDGHSVLNQDGYLDPDQRLMSPDGRFTFTNSNRGGRSALVIRGPGGADKYIWVCGNFNPNGYDYGDGNLPPAGRLIIQGSDANLVLYSGGNPFWASQKMVDNGNPFLYLDNNGVLGVYANGGVIWYCDNSPNKRWGY